MAETERVDDGLFAGQSTISIMLTRRCNMTCAHCSVESGPRIRKEPADAEVLALVDQAVESGVAGLLVTGGEPMLRERLVLEILRRAKRRGLPVAMATNGFWGKKRTTAWQKVRSLKRAGLGKLTVSYDRYHAEFQGPEPALNIAGAAEWFDLQLNINITRVADDPELAALVAPFVGHHQKMRFYDVQAIGRARQLPIAELRSETSGYCNACRAPSLTDDGRVTACNGPSYFVAPGSPLAVGSVREASLKDLLERHRTDPILETIRLFGPSRLLKELEGMGGAARFGLRASHSGLCDVCLDVNTNTEAVAALRERLADRRLAAERAARRLVLDASVASGAHAPEFVNGVAAARVWMRVGSGDDPRWPRDPEKLLGRSDFDWKQSSDYLAACGVARAIHPALEDSELTRWAPRFFAAQLRKAAVREGMRELIQRDIIRRLDEALTELNVRGILLKGAALLAIDDARTRSGQSGEGAMNRRAGGDVDLLVPANEALRLRELLLSRGFTGVHDGPRTGPHHLAPVSLQGVQVELHTRIMPRFWGLPEKEMVGLARPIAGVDSLSTLDPQGMLLHALVHSTAHLFSLGLRAAWDAAWILRTFPNADLSQLNAWVNESRMPRAFWVPAGFIHSQQIVALPKALTNWVPSDERQRRLERVARARMFAALETAFELNPFSKNGFFMMLQDSPVGRARHLASLLGHDERESRRASARTLRRADPSGHSSGLGFQLRQGVAQWRAFKRAVAQP